MDEPIDPTKHDSGEVNPPDPLRMVREILTEPARPAYSVTLGYDERRKSRQRVSIAGAGEWFFLLERGSTLRAGDCVRANDGTVIQVLAAAETLSVVITTDLCLLARVAYHLGNRHVPLQIEPGRVSYQHDHVLDGLVHSLGLSVQVVAAPFEPEVGPYRTHGADAGHGHDQGHDHGHEPGHRHRSSPSAHADPEHGHHHHNKVK